MFQCMCKNIKNETDDKIRWYPYWNTIKDDNDVATKDADKKRKIETCFPLLRSFFIIK